jgi:hypothetical protein
MVISIRIAIKQSLERFNKRNSSWEGTQNIKNWIVANYSYNLRKIFEF